MRKGSCNFLLTLWILGIPVAWALEDTALWVLEDANPASAVLFPWMVQVIGVCCFFLLTRFEIPLPYAAVMFVIGIFMGLGSVASARRAENTESLDKLSTSILQWSNINSAVLLLVFLPGLIFRDAIEVNFNMFMASLPQILLLAFPMVLVGTILTALVGTYVIPYNWPWSLAATLGAILASTDPVAVGSVLKKAGAPPRLQLLISGESLLNDGSAVSLV
jgi:NhaP-type Na+/H+ or K+/H+ antiporter